MQTRIIFILMSVVVSSLIMGCDSQKSETSSKDTAIVATPVSESTAEAKELALTTIQFEESSFDFGKVDEGKKVEHIFKFTNTGENPLVLKDARASCGCTIPEYTKDTIAPGKVGELKVIYDSAGKEGKIEKTVTVTANTEPSMTDLKIQVFVLKKVAGPFNDKK